MCSQVVVLFVIMVVMCGDIIFSVLVLGQIEVSQLVSVGVCVLGWIEMLLVSFGQIVKVGDLIVEMDLLDQQNEVKQVEVDLVNIQVQIVVKNVNLICVWQVLEWQKKLGISNFLL